MPQLEKVYSNKDPGQSKVTLKKGRQKEEEIGGREKSERSSSALGRVINNGFVWEGELTVHLLGMPVEESGQETGQPPKDRGPTTATAGALTHSPSHLVLALPFPLFLLCNQRVFKYHQILLEINVGINVLEIAVDRQMLLERKSRLDV